MMSMGPLSQGLGCPLLTTVKPQGGHTHQQLDTDSPASPRQAQVLLPVPTLRWPTLRCPIHRDRTLRGHISKVLHSKAFLETPWVSGYTEDEMTVYV